MLPPDRADLVAERLFETAIRDAGRGGAGGEVVGGEGVSGMAGVLFVTAD